MVNGSERTGRGGARSPWLKAAPWLLGLVALCGLIAVVAHLGELERFLSIARTARPEWLLLALAAQAGTYGCAAAVWQRTLQRTGHPRPLASLIPLGIAKLFTDQAIPTGGVSGIMLVMHGLRRREVPGETAAAVLLVGVLSFYAAYLLVVLLSLVVLLLHHRASPALVGGAALFACLAVAIPAAVLWLKRRGAGGLPNWTRRIGGIAEIMEAVGNAPRGLLGDRVLLAETIAAQLAVFVLDALTLWLVFLAIGQPVDLWVVFASFVMASVAASIGIVPLGLGTFEAGSVAMLGLLGVPVENALTATLLLRGLTFWLPMLPGLWLARRELGRGGGSSVSPTRQV